MAELSELRHVVIAEASPAIPLGSGSGWLRSGWGVAKSYEIASR
jgi:hypothetical protein